MEYHQNCDGKPSDLATRSHGGRCANEVENQLSTNWLIGYVLSIVNRWDSNEGATAALFSEQARLRAHTHLTADDARTAAKFLFAIPQLNERQLATFAPDPPKKGSSSQKADWGFSCESTYICEIAAF